MRAHAVVRVRERRIKFNPINQPTETLRDDGQRTTKYGLPKKTVKECVVGSAYTYKVQEGYDGVGIRKEGTIRNYGRYVLSKSTIH